MTQQNLTIGVANGGTGDSLFSAATKIQANFSELYNGVPVVNVKNPAYGALGDDSTDDTAAVLLAAAAANALGAGTGAILYFPRGYYILSDTIAITSPRVHIEGDGKYATMIRFIPTSAKSCFKFQNSNTALVLYQCSIRRMGLLANGVETNQKIAIDLIDCSETLVEEIAISSSWQGNSGSTATPSIGIRTKGRELLTVRQVDIFADRPIHITRNTNAPSLSADHFHLTDCYLGIQVSTESGVLIDGDVGMANFVVDGYQSYVGGKYGIKYSSGSVPSTMLGAQINNLRFEQAADATGYAVSWEGASYNLTLINANFGGTSTSNGGLFIRNVTRVTLVGTMYTGTGTAMNADTTCDDIHFVNAFFQTGSTVTLTGFEEVMGMPIVGGCPIAPCSHWFRTGASARLMREWGIFKTKYNGSLTVGATRDLVLGGSAANKTAQVFVSAYSVTGPTEAMAMFHVTGSSAALISGTANTSVGNVGGKLCLLWNSISSVQVLNNLAQTVSIVIREYWTTT